MLHLGDYIYEYQNGAFGDGSRFERAPEPDRETIGLEDYRRRHAQYKTDPDLMAAHQRHPFLVVWDDHELANDAHRAGAENHQPESEGDWELRKTNAIQAYREWMPIRREPSDRFERIYRHFRAGDLADLMLLDTRVIGRDEPVDDPCNAEAVADPARQLLGPDQEDWLVAELRRSVERGTRWRVLGQQVMLGQLINVLEMPVCIFNPDQWDGYPASRARLLDELRRSEMDNVLVLTGDIHSSWALDVTDDPFDPALYDGASGAGSLAVELVTPGVTSPGVEDPLEALQFAALIRATHPHVKHVDLHRRGYLSVELTHERVLARWHHVATLEEPDASVVPGAALEVRSGENRLRPLGDDATAPRAVAG